ILAGLILTVKSVAFVDDLSATLLIKKILNDVFGDVEANRQINTNRIVAEGGPLEHFGCRSAGLSFITRLEELNHFRAVSEINIAVVIRDAGDAPVVTEIEQTENTFRSVFQSPAFATRNRFLELGKFLGDAGERSIHSNIELFFLSGRSDTDYLKPELIILKANRSVVVKI